MLPSSREIVFHSAISTMSLADEATLHVIDNNCNLYKIDLPTLKIIKSTSLSNIYEQTNFDYYQRPFALGAKNAYISFSKKGSEYVIDTRAKLVKLSNFFYNHDIAVTKASFSDNDTLLVTGNERGRTYVINPEDGNIQTELPRSNDTISAVAISDEFKLCARASFSKTILVYRLNSLKVIFQKKLDSVIEMLIFLDKNTLLAITKNSKIIKIDFENEKISKETMLGEDLWPSSMTLSHSKKFVYVGTRESMLFALHVKTLDILFQIKLPYLGITSMIRTARYFIAGFKTGEVVFFNHREFEEQFIVDIRLKKVKEASLLFIKNVFLMSHRETRLIYDYWLEEKETIVNLLSKGELEQAISAAEPFLFHPKCKVEFYELEELQPDLMALQRYIRSFSFNAAYELANVKPSLKKSSIFLNLEALWNKSLQKAQILLSREPLLNKEAARDSLKLFMNVEEKNFIIENMLKRTGLFSMSESAIREKNFALYFKLVSQNKFLEFTPLYQKVLLLGEKLQMEISKLLEEKNYQKSLILSDILHQFTPYQNQAHRLKDVSKALMILEYQIEDNRLFEAVKTQEQFQLETNYLLVRTLELMKKEFQSKLLILIEARKYSEVYRAIFPYIAISICKNQVATVMKHFYMTQFRDAKNLQTIDWEKSFRLYLNLFTMDKLLMDFAKEINQFEMLLSLDKIERIEGISEYPKTVLVKNT